MCQIQRTRVSEKADAWANIAKINNVSAWPCESRRQATNARVDTMARKVHIDLAWKSRKVSNLKLGLLHSFVPVDPTVNGYGMQGYVANSISTESNARL